MLVLIKTGVFKNQFKKVLFVTPENEIAIKEDGVIRMYKEEEFEIVNDEPTIPEAFDSGDQIYIPKPPEQGPGETYLEPWPNPGWEEGPGEGGLAKESLDVKNERLQKEIEYLHRELKKSEERADKAMKKADELEKEIDIMNMYWGLDKKRLERAERVIDVLTNESR